MNAAVGLDPNVERSLRLDRTPAAALAVPARTPDASLSHAARAPCGIRAHRDREQRLSGMLLHALIRAVLQQRAVKRSQLAHGTATRFVACTAAPRGARRPPVTDRVQSASDDGWRCRR